MTLEVSEVVVSAGQSEAHYWISELVSCTQELWVHAVCHSVVLVNFSWAWNMSCQSRFGQSCSCFVFMEAAVMNGAQVVLGMNIVRSCNNLFSD